MNKQYKKLKGLPDALTTEQVLDVLPIGKNTLYSLLKNKRLKSIRCGTKYIIPKRFLMDFLEQDIYNEDTHLEI